MKQLLRVCFVLLAFSPAVQAVDLSGSPQELRQALGMPGPATLSAWGEVKVKNDELVFRIRVSTVDKTLSGALRENEQTRAGLVQALAKAGIPGAQVATSKFSGDADRQLFSEKAKSYTVAGVITVRALTAEQAQAAAAVFETRADSVFESLTQADSRRADHEREALSLAMEELNRRRELVEKGLGVTLRPRQIETRDAVSGEAPPRMETGKGVGSGSFSMASGMVYSKLESGFDDARYRMAVEAVYDVVVPPGK